MLTFYVSSYGKNDDKGIYIVNLDEKTQKFSLVQHIVTQDYPSYMITKNNTLFLSYKNAGKFNDGGGIGSFSIYKDELIPNNNYNSNGRSYTHLCVSDNLRYLFAANYHVGSTASYLLENNYIKQKINAVHHTGLGPDLLKRQTGPHCHCVGITPDKKYVYAVDLGADKMSKTKDGNEPIYYARGDDVKNYLAGNDNIAREGTPEDNLEGDETVVADNNTADENNNTEEAMNNEEETAAEEEVAAENEEYAQNDTAEEEATAENEEEVVEEQTEEVYVDNTINAVDLDVKQLELLVAVKNNDIIALNTLIKEGVNPNFIDENGYTPLHLAVINSNLDTVEALLKYKDINKEAKLPYKATLNNWYLGGATPLIVASYVGNADIVYTLLEAGCDIRARDDIDGAMPIHVASANGNDDAVILLLEKDKTLVNEADKNGNDTPLHWAAMKNKPSTINVLLKYGADTKIQNSDGNTALHYAAMYASSDVVKNIVASDKSSVNMANNENMYPIHYAALENNTDALVALVQNGKADVNIKDSNNDTALHYAAAYGNMDSVVALVEKCYADKTLKDNDGYMAADLASDNGYNNIANYLRGAAYIPDNNNQDNTGDRQELILPEYNKKPNLDKKWW